MHEFDHWLKLALDTRGYQGKAVADLNKIFIDLRFNCRMDEPTLVFLQMVLFNI